MWITNRKSKYGFRDARQSCNMADKLRTLNVANVLKDNLAVCVECEGINIEWTNKVKITEW